MSSSSHLEPCDSDHGIPASLLEAVSQARPTCPFWGSKQGCRKDIKCALRHAAKNDVHLPHISRHVLADGSTTINLRPPLMKGLEKCFSSKKCPLPISHGEMWETAKGVRLVTYLLPLMEGANLQACAQAAQCGFAIQANGSRLSTSRGCDFSQLLLHGTTVKNALSILCDGRINPSPGIAGDGIYGF